MMILPLADALMNCLQNLTSRIAGMDNEQMTGRVMGIGTMLGFGIGAIKQQFSSNNANINNTNSNNSNSNSGLQGFINRAKSVINPSINLSAERDYNGNINPIRQSVPKENKNIEVAKSENVSTVNNNKNTSPIGRIAKTGYNATKTYMNIGARMAEGDFDKEYRGKATNKGKNFQNTAYINKLNIENEIQKQGDEDDSKEEM